MYKILITLMLSLKVASNDYKVSTQELGCEDNFQVKDNFVICLVKIDVQIKKEDTTFKSIYTNTQYIGSSNKKITHLFNNSRDIGTIPDFEIQIDNYKYIKDLYYETFDALQFFVIDKKYDSQREDIKFPVVAGYDIALTDVHYTQLYFFQGTEDKMEKFKKNFKLKDGEIKKIVDSRLLII